MSQNRFRVAVLDKFQHHWICWDFLSGALFKKGCVLLNLLKKMLLLPVAEMPTDLKQSYRCAALRNWALFPYNLSPRSLKQNSFAQICIALPERNITQESQIDGFRIQNKPFQCQEFRIRLWERICKIAERTENKCSVKRPFVAALLLCDEISIPLQVVLQINEEYSPQSCKVTSPNWNNYVSE